MAGKTRTSGQGRPKGTPNKLTASVKEAIEHAAREIGGAARLADWAKEAPENEKVFWSSIYPKLLPLQVTGKDGGPLLVADASVLDDRTLAAIAAGGSPRAAKAPGGPSQPG